MGKIKELYTQQQEELRNERDNLLGWHDWRNYTSNKDRFIAEQEALVEIDEHSDEAYEQELDNQMA